MPYKDPEAKKAYLKAYYMAHKEKMKIRAKEYSKIYYPAHIDQKRVITKKYYLEHWEKLKICSYNNYILHREEKELRRHTIRITHPEEIHQKDMAYRISHKEEIKNNGKRMRQALRLEVLNFYGGKCACCGEAEICFLAIDHINGGGNKHRKEIGGSKIYFWLKANNFPSGFQVLCHNCNLAKGFYGICPHNVQNEKEKNNV
jgi:hypothetical protein